MTELQQSKVKGVVDIAFVLDATGSMQPAIDDIKNNISVFIDGLTTADANNTQPVKDWRAKVVGYRDYDADGDAWFVDNPFVRSGEEVKIQLTRLRAEGGGDEPESLLDALHKVANVGSTEAGHEDAWQWRHRHEAARVVIVFTDASYQPTVSIPEGRGGDLNEIVNHITQNKIILSIFAPDMPCYDELASIDKAELMAVPYDSHPEGAVGALRDFTADTENFKTTLKQLAASVSKSAAVTL